MSTDLIPHGQLHDHVLEAVRTDWVDGRWTPGTPVSMEQLEDRYQVSRTVIREAVRVLSSVGIVTSRRRVGVRFQPPELWEALSPLVIRWKLAGPHRDDQLRELSEIRRGIEPVAAALAADRASEEQCMKITEAVVGMSITGPRGDLTKYLQHDIDFHRTVLEASGNSGLAAFSPLVAEALTGRTAYDLMPTRPEPQAIAWHRQVAEAICSKDASAAYAAASSIVDEAQAAMAAGAAEHAGRSVVESEPDPAH